MTRELKLALIIAVTLVLSVMVLISDHLAVQRRPKLADVAATQPIGTPPPPVAEPPVSAPKEPAVAEQPQGTVPPVRVAEAGQPVDGGKGVVGSSDDHTELAQVVKSYGGEVKKGVMTLPPLAQGGSEPLEGDVVGGELSKSKFPTSPIEPTEIVQSLGGKGGKSDASTPAAASGKTHIVAPGDTAYKLARIYLGDGKYWKKIVDANPKAFNGDGQIKVGAQLVIPTTGAPAPVKASPASPDAKPSPTRMADASDKSKAKAYTIRKGDTLHSIAKRELGSSGRVDEIIRLNKGVIKDPTSLPLGVAIVLPSDQH